MVNYLGEGKIPTKLLWPLIAVIVVAIIGVAFVVAFKDLRHWGLGILAGDIFFYFSWLSKALKKEIAVREEQDE